MATTKPVDWDSVYDCLCGCGGRPKSTKSYWLPGHDGRHGGHLLRRVRNHADERAAAQLIRRGWYAPLGVVAEMIDGTARKTNAM